MMGNFSVISRVLLRVDLPHLVAIVMSGTGTVREYSDWESFAHQR